MDNEITNEIETNPCDVYEQECRQLSCPYGMRRVAADAQCSRCICENPCEQYTCPDYQQCVVEVSSDTSTKFMPVCRDKQKPGECPQLAAPRDDDCRRECYTDADCREESKCCSAGCSSVCVRPSVPTSRPTTPLPVVMYPGEVQVALEPKSPEEVNIQTPVGGIAVLRCFATGSPAPTVTWTRKDILVSSCFLKLFKFISIFPLD